MKAWLLQKPGSPDTLKGSDAARPEPGPGEVRVRVRAVGLNPVDYKLAAAGHPAWTYPFILGLDVAGIVDALGENVRTLQVGESVFYHGDLRRPGGLAEYAVAAAHAVSSIPTGLRFIDAAALPCAGFTAFQALRRMHIQPGQTVLVHGGAGGVGGFAVQLAAREQARVLATCQQHHHEYVQALGATATVDYRTENVAERVMALTDGRGVDAIVDTVSAESATQGLTQLLAFGGQLAAVAGLPDLKQLPWGKCFSVHEIALGAAHLLGGRVAQEDLARIGSTLAHEMVRGALRSTVSHVVPFEKAPEALSALQRGGHRGKTVVDFSGFSVT